jgi:RNA polymerase sigma factor (sigma-70 family)
VDIDLNIPEASSAEARYRHLFEASFAEVWGFARRRCDSGQDADDVTAETFAIAWRRRDDLTVDQTRLWLFGVVRRVLANQRRSAERQKNVRVRLAEAEQQEVSADDPRESHRAVRAALNELSADDRELLIMQAWDDLSIREMAVILDCSPNAVSVRLCRARKKLARELWGKENIRSGHVACGTLSTEGEMS